MTVIGYNDHRLTLFTECSISGSLIYLHIDWSADRRLLSNDNMLWWQAHILRISGSNWEGGHNPETDSHVTIPILNYNKMATMLSTVLNYYVLTFKLIIWYNALITYILGVERLLIYFKSTFMRWKLSRRRLVADDVINEQIKSWPMNAAIYSRPSAVSLKVWLHKTRVYVTTI